MGLLSSFKIFSHLKIVINYENHPIFHLFESSLSVTNFIFIMIICTCLLISNYNKKCYWSEQGSVTKCNLCLTDIILFFHFWILINKKHIFFILLIESTWNVGNMRAQNSNLFTIKKSCNSETRKLQTLMKLLLLPSILVCEWSDLSYCYCGQK